MEVAQGDGLMPTEIVIDGGKSGVGAGWMSAVNEKRLFYFGPEAVGEEVAKGDEDESGHRKETNILTEQHCHENANTRSMHHEEYMGHNLEYLNQNMENSANDQAVKTERRLIIIPPGVDPDVEMQRAINQITEELDRKAAAAISAGEVPAKETVIEITRVISTDHVRPVVGNFQNEVRVNLEGNKPSEVENQSVGGSWKTSKRDSAAFRVDEFRTPSPLLPAWDKRPSSATTGGTSDRVSTEDFYFRSSPVGRSPHLLQTQKSCPAVTDRGSNILRIDDGRILANESDRLTTPADDVLVPINRPALTKFSRDCSLNLVFTGRADNDSARGPVMNIVNFANKFPSALTKERTNRHKKRPAYSYMQLIQMAIASSPQLCMTLRQIYQWIETQFPYYKHYAHQGWKNSIRHNLSLYDMFVRVKARPMASRQTASHWTLRDSIDATQLRAELQRLGTGSPLQPDDVSSRNDVVVSPNTSMLSSHSVNVMRDAIYCHQHKTNRKTPVPLLPKPPTHLQTITLLPVTSVGHQFSSVQQLQLVGSQLTAPPGSSNNNTLQQSNGPHFTTAFTPLNSSSSSYTLQSSTSNQPTATASKLLLKRSADSGPYETPPAELLPKFKVVRRSLNQPNIVTSANILTRHSVASVPIAARSDSVLSGPTDGDKSQLTASLDTSTLRHQLSNLNFDSNLDSSVQLTTAERSAKSASDIILSRSSCEIASSGSGSAAETGLAQKPATSRSRRRKQEFSNLLRTPPNMRQKTTNDLDEELTTHALNSSFLPITETSFMSRSTATHSDSGFGASTQFSETSNLDSGMDAFHNESFRPRTPPSQIRHRSPIQDSMEESSSSCGTKPEMESNVDDELMMINEMLFTPFKTDIIGGMLSSDFSPDVDLSTSIIPESDSWIPSFAANSSVGPAARTSTPCRLLCTSTPRSDRGNPTMDLTPKEHQRQRQEEPSPGLFARLLSDLDDDPEIFGCFIASGRGDGPGDIMLRGNGDNSLSELTCASGSFALDEGVELDVSEMNFCQT